MLGNLSKTILYGCAAVGSATTLGVLAAPFNKKLGFAVFCGVLGGASYLYYKYIYQPEQIKANINKVARDMGYDDDMHLRSPREFPIRQTEGTLAFTQTHSSSSQQYSDGATTDGDFTDDEHEHFKDIDLSDEGDDNPMPRATPSSPSVNLKPGLANYILSFVGLGQMEKAKTIYKELRNGSR